MASEAVLKFLEYHNRPFSINDIQQGVKGDFGKTAIQKALDSLVEKDKVKEKKYGKQKVYCIVQQNDSSTADLKEGLLDIDRKINDTSTQLKEVSDKLKSAAAQVSEQKGKLSLEEAVSQKVRLEREIEEMKKELEKCPFTIEICPKEKIETEKGYERYLDQYRKRKRMCMDILDSILENYPKSKKHLFDEIGIETDEDAGFSVK